MTFKKIVNKIKAFAHREKDISSYCSVCGTCGYIGCCGVEEFLEMHVRGKTNCLNEDGMIQEIISLYKSEYDEVIDEELWGEDA